jgi:hypothetical protein
MDTLGKDHIDFLRQCASTPNKVHSSDLPFDDLRKMVDEGLLIQYSRVPVAYAITKIGVQVAKTFGASPELIKLATDYVQSKGYDESAAKGIVEEHGAESILQSQATELRQTGQKEITVPINELGKPEIKYRG